MPIRTHELKGYGVGFLGQKREKKESGKKSVQKREKGFHFKNQRKKKGCFPFKSEGAERVKEWCELGVYFGKEKKGNAET